MFFIHRQILQRRKKTFWLGRKCLRLSRPSHHLPVSLPFLLFSHFFPPLLWVFIFYLAEIWMVAARGREGANETFIREEQSTKKEKKGRRKKNWNVSHKNFPLSTFRSALCWCVYILRRNLRGSKCAEQENNWKNPGDENRHFLRNFVFPSFSAAARKLFEWK